MEVTRNPTAQADFGGLAVLSAGLARSLAEENPNSNLVFSPLSIYGALALLAAGTRGDTLDEILRVVGARSRSELEEIVARVVAGDTLKDQSDSGGPCVAFASGIWSDHTCPLKPTFREVVVGKYKAEASTVDFIGNPEQARSQINAWVAQATRNLIGSVFGPGSITPLTSVVLGNAIYFKGKWFEPFDKSDTRNKRFHRLDGGTVDVPFMQSWEPQFIAVHDGFKTNRAWIRDITGPLTVQVITQFLMLVDALQAVNLTTEVSDRVVWKWTSSASYSASSTYKAFFLGLEFFPCGKALWKAWAPAKCKVHAWLAMRRRLWTADRMRRRGMNSHTTCPLCDQEPETADHIALGCVYAREVWLNLLRRCNLHMFVPGADDVFIEWWPDGRRRIPPQAKKGFDSLVLLVVWSLWKERNARVFERKSATVSTVCRLIADEVELWKLSGAVGLGKIWE